MLIIVLPQNIYANQNAPGVEKLVAKNLKKAMPKKIEIGGQGLLLLMELKFLITVTRLQNVTGACQLQSYSGRQQ